MAHTNFTEFVGRRLTSEFIWAIVVCVHCVVVRFSDNLSTLFKENMRYTSKNKKNYLYCIFRID